MIDSHVQSRRERAVQADVAQSSCCTPRTAPALASGCCGGAHAEGHETPAATAVKDPVCGMSVDPHAAKHRAEHDGHPYYFCSASCRTKFLADPERYLDTGKVAKAERLPDGAIYTCPMHPDRFADHRFIFAVHTDKESEWHIHAHTVITVRNEAGQKIHPSRDTFREWQQAYAEHAQAEGLKIVATGARERASSQSYGPRDKAIVAAAERPRPVREARDRAYAADPANRCLIDNARQRIRTARANPVRLPVTGEDRRAAGEHVAIWRQGAEEQPGNATVLGMLTRLATAEAVGSGASCTRSAGE